MLKQAVTIIIMVVVCNAIFVYFGGLDALIATKYREHAYIPTHNDSTEVSADIVDVFKFTLNDEVVKKIGQPREGFEPAMYLTAFSGLVETDFDGVEASIGAYRVVNGRLEHQLPDDQPVHSAAGAVTRTGIETLLQNVADRAGLDLEHSSTLTDIVSVITAQ